jgi:histidine triad (HIT) family protein
VAQIVGRGIQRAFDPPRVGQMIAGFEVPHVHIHVLQVAELGDLSFARAARNPDPTEMDAVADELRTALRELGYGLNVDATR